MNVDSRSIQGTGHDDPILIVCIDHGYPRKDATPMLVAKDRRTGMVFALSVEKKGAADPHAVEKLGEWVDALGSTQVTTSRDGEPAVTQVGARRAESVITLETSAPTLEMKWPRAVELVGGMVRTRRNLSSTARCLPLLG